MLGIMSAYQIKLASRKALAALILLFLCVSPCLSQEDSVTVTTYYPTPQGAYSRLRLTPTVCTTDGTCTRPGEMCFDSSINKLLICQNTTWSQGSTPWAMIPNTRNIYLTVSGNVGVGTNNPRSKLDVRGKTDVCTQVVYHYTSGRQRCPYGTAIVQPRAQKPFNFASIDPMTSARPNITMVDSFYCCATCYKEAPTGFLYMEGFQPGQFFSYSPARVREDDNNNGICDD
jgi:hypothetical protein